MAFQLDVPPPMLAVEMRGIYKYFPSSHVLANDEVDLSVEQGQVHALVGENGAGKTTLMSILFGLVQPDRGTIAINEKQVQIPNPDEAIRLGIGMVHQHFKLVPSFTVAQNILLGIERDRFGLLNQRDENQRVQELANEYGLPVDPDAVVADLPVSMQQRVEILKALERKARILILDEPTAVLTPQEARELFTVIRTLVERGHTVIFITHKLLEVIEVADKVSVMRAGKLIGTQPVRDTNLREMAHMMVGREVILTVDKTAAKPGDPVLEVEHLLVAGVGGHTAISDLSLTVRAGEIVGIAGVSGNGQTELVEAITGTESVDGGTIRMRGKIITAEPVWNRRKQGMAHIPEDRLRTGLNLQTNLDENVIVSRYREPEFERFGVLDQARIRKLAEWVVKQFSVASARPGEDIATLSGGNLQKVVLGRELSGSPTLIIANQPTRGLDVGSIEFVHRTLVEARDRGAAVLLISVELDEIMALSDRILVLFRGRIAGELDGETANKEELGILMAGGTTEKQATAGV